MRKAIASTIVLVALVGTAFAGAAPQRGEVSIFGVTLGRTLKESNVRHCTSSHDSGPCYFSDDGLTKLRTDLKGLFVDTYIQFENGLGSPVEGIMVSIGWHEHDYNLFLDNFEQLLSLSLKKFGKPIKTERHVVQNLVGGQFERVDVTWEIGGNFIFLSNTAGGIVANGVLHAVSKKKSERISKAAKAAEKADRDKF